jgi:hypothetical protein
MSDATAQPINFVVDQLTQARADVDAGRMSPEAFEDLVQTVRGHAEADRDALDAAREAVGEHLDLAHDALVQGNAATTPEVRAEQAADVVDHVLDARQVTMDLTIEFDQDLIDAGREIVEARAEAGADADIISADRVQLDGMQDHLGVQEADYAGHMDEVRDHAGGEEASSDAQGFDTIAHDA